MRFLSIVLLRTFRNKSIYKQGDTQDVRYP